MVKKRCFTWLLSLLPLLLAIAVPPATAQSPHHAALIVDFGDGRVVVRVVSFAGETISGVDLLQQSGLDVAVMVNLGGGAALCAVEGVGCAPTPQDCFCQCRGTPCYYWSYFHLQDGAWVYAGMGAADHVLRDGDVDGWIWGDGRTAPPLLTWDEIWARSGAAQPTLPPAPPSQTPLPPATAGPPPVTIPTEPAGVPTPGTTRSATALPTPTRSPAPSSAPPTVVRRTEVGITSTPAMSATPPAALRETGVPVPTTSTVSGEAPGTGVPWGPLAAFGGLALFLLALGLWVRRRRY